MPYVSVEVDVEDVIDAVSDEMLLDEVHRRELGPHESLRDELSRAATADVKTIVERMLNPKWHSIDACRKQYNLEMGR